jgi:hypothetical protein
MVARAGIYPAYTTMSPALGSRDSFVAASSHTADGLRRNCGGSVGHVEQHGDVLPLLDEAEHIDERTAR